MRDLYGHQFVCLNPNHPDQDTPPQIRDWLDLIYQSIHSPERPVLNTENAGIRKAVELISFENLSPEERTQAKNKEAARVTVAKIENRKAFEIAKNLILLGSDNTFIEKATGLTIEEIEKLRNQDE
jgi:hypothetical protein